MNTVADSTLSVFRNLKVILEAFQEYRKKPITFDGITYEFYEEFVHYLTFEHIHQNRKNNVKGFKTNTVGKLAEILQPIKHSYMKGNRNIAEIKPKYEWITSHTCRRSFCTNEFLAGTPVDLIIKISGHKSLKDFYKYIKIAPEQAGQKIKEL